MNENNNEGKQWSKLTPEFYYSLLPKKVKESLNSEQSYAVKMLLKRVVRIPSKKILDLEVTFWCFKRFYVTLYFGRDLRRRKRNFETKRDQLLSQFLTLMIYLGMVTFVGVLAAACYFLVMAIIG